MSGSRNLNQNDVRSAKAEDGILENQELVEFLYEVQERFKVEMAQATIAYRESRDKMCESERRYHLATKMVEILLCRPAPTVMNP